MEILVIGAGSVGKVTVRSLVQQQQIDSIVIADRGLRRAQHIAEQVLDARVSAVRLDATAKRAVREQMAGCTVVINTLPSFLSLSLARSAIVTGVSFCDLSENQRVVSDILALDKEARDAEVLIIPACGLNPGLVNILALAAIDNLDYTDTMNIHFGRLPEDPNSGLGCQLYDDANQLMDSYTEDVTVIEDGTTRMVSPLTGKEQVSFPAPYNRMEAFHSSGLSRTLLETLRNRVRHLSYKTISYPGHAKRIRCLVNMGFLSPRKRQLEEAEIAPRDLSKQLFTEYLSRGQPDVVLLRVSASGEKSDKEVKVCYELMDHYDSGQGLSAADHIAGLAVAQTAWLLGTGEIAGCGVRSAEDCVPYERYIQGLRDLGLSITNTRG